MGMYSVCLSRQLIRQSQRKSQRRTLCDRPHRLQEKALAAAGVGCLAGSLGSLVGMGGAFITIPLLTHPFFGLSQRIAQGTSMASVLATAFGGVIGYMSPPRSTTSLCTPPPGTISRMDLSRPYFIGNVSIPTALLVSLASTFTAMAGAKFSKKLSSRQLKISLGIFMLSVAPSPVLKEYLANAKNGVEQVKPIPKTAIDWINELQLSLLIGAFSGFQAGLFGVGGGAVVVPALCLFTDLTYKESLGTSMAIMLPTAVAGTMQHYRQGTMIRTIAIPLGIGCFLGSFMGGSLVTYFIDANKETKLRCCFTTVMIGLGLRTLRGGLRHIK